MRLSVCTFTLAVALSAPSARAQHQTFAINPDASDVKITLRTNHEIVHGTFHVQSGAIELDRSARQIGGTVVISAGSGKTGNESRDRKMDKDILDVQQYGTISFAPESFTGIIAPIGDSTIQVTGVFTLVGRSHDLTVPMQVHLEGKNGTVKGHLVVPYVQWGLKNPSFLIWKADDTVGVDLILVGHIS